MSFVVLAYNGGAVLSDCVASILSVRGEGLEVLVVDNGSDDGSIERLRVMHPRLRIIRNGANLGFAAGMNRGIAASRGTFVVPVNQDAFLRPEFASSVCAVFADDPKIGAVGGRVLRQDASGTEEVDSAGYLLARRFAASGPVLDEPRDVFGVTGACPALRRSMLEDIALIPGEFFDESYFMYFEDIDLFFRALLRGWRVRALPQVVATHHRSWSAGGGRRFYQKPLPLQRLHFRNRYATMVKNCPLVLLPDILPGVLAAELMIFPYLLWRRPSALIALLQAWRDTLVALPGLLRTRGLIQRRRRIPTSALRHLLDGL